MPDNYNPRLYARTYASSTTTVGTQAKPTVTPPCAPPCADCGLLECLCRPRFFAGQLLTEKDLNRLDAYIRAKNKLHNRQLFGSGVVNGLDVRCEPCGTGVVVGTGYALSPCGDDIIVCADTSVDVCALVKKCQPVDKSCQPMQGTSAQGCEDLVEDWVLAIRYSESPARGVAALRMGASCSCGAGAGTCSCGAKSSSSSCGCGAKPSSSCGCGAKSSPSSSSCGCGTATPSSTKPRNSSAECEPTVICEGYSFDVFPAPKPQPREKQTQLQGELWDRIRCCIQPLLTIFSSAPGAAGAASYNEDPQGWNLWCCQSKQVLLDYFSSGPQASCTIAQKLMLLVCPDPQSESFAAEMATVVDIIVLLIVEAVQACLCAALLPPAPCGTDDDRIPLAIVRVRKRDCMVIDVCNWTPLRKTVLTFPTLEYWFGWIPWFGALAELIHSMCCSAPARLAGVREMRTNSGATANAAAASGNTTMYMFAQPHQAAASRINPTLPANVVDGNRIFGSLIANAMGRGTTPLDPRAFAGGLLGVDLGGKQPLSAEEKANPAPFLFLNEVLRPIANNIFGQPQMAEALHHAVAATPASGAAPPPPATHEEISAMKERISALEEALKKTHRKG